MKIKILYEDANILAIEKPSGISVHGDGRSKEKTIADWILENYPKLKTVGEKPQKNEEKNEGPIFVNIPRPGIVHRLDNGTSGVMLVAKNQKAYLHLKSQFQNREIKKTYVAIVNGSLKNERGVINKPIGRSPKDFRRYSAGRGARGEMVEAITRYKVVKRFEDSKGNKFTALEVFPKTGRTHQIRVHMKYLNHPVACDPLYNPDVACPQGFKRMGLHAKQIELIGLNGKILKIESPLPKEFKEVLK